MDGACAYGMHVCTDLRADADGAADANRRDLRHVRPRHHLGHARDHADADAAGVPIAMASASTAHVPVVVAAAVGTPVPATGVTARSCPLRVRLFTDSIGRLNSKSKEYIDDVRTLVGSADRIVVFKVQFTGGDLPQVAAYFDGCCSPSDLNLACDFKFPRSYPQLWVGTSCRNKNK